ncbi:carboxypeptidase-like regulatory domain-containing protein [Alienimonas sp. DA493]|uniref:carboxypeptidase-like regulatory domain-containing protein n=1 Tax=Alienimonas sp. DA493 TaxID=3373605 RepID=UPI003754293A
MFSFAVVVASGCGGSPDRPELGEVAGTVTDGGAPVVDAAVEFSPQTGRPSVGTTDAEGRYSLRYTVDAEGAQLGPHTVRITPYNEPPPAPGEPGSDRPPAAAAPAVTVPDPVVVEAGDNNFDFDLDTLGS